MANSDAELRRLIDSIVNGDRGGFSDLLSKNRTLAMARFEATNATRREAKENFVAGAGKYIYRGDTALHFAAATYKAEEIRELISLGADVRARNRLGDEPLHAAAVGTPGSERWKPDAQCEAIRALMEAGADPNALNKMGVCPLHKAVRTRCAEAVRALLELGADPAVRNKSGSDALLLARMSTGRGGSGSPEAKAQQRQILELLGKA